jgi:hypothetical protein
VNSAIARSVARAPASSRNSAAVSAQSWALCVWRVLSLARAGHRRHHRPISEHLDRLATKATVLFKTTR